MTRTFTAVFQPAEEGGYIAFVEELPGANTQGETLEEARENLREAVEMVLEANRELALADVNEENVIREELVLTR
jgi:predicted RNase H-like HicB family nuclease